MKTKKKIVKVVKTKNESPKAMRYNRELQSYLELLDRAGHDMRLYTSYVRPKGLVPDPKMVEANQKREAGVQARLEARERGRQKDLEFQKSWDARHHRKAEQEDVPAEVVKVEKPKQQKPGVIKTIIGYLEGASKKKPITREEIVKRLVKEFPDREVKAMSSTVSSQVPGALLVEKGIKVSGEKVKGFWIEKGGK